MRPHAGSLARELWGLRIDPAWLEHLARDRHLSRARSNAAARGRSPGARFGPVGGFHAMLWRAPNPDDSPAVGLRATQRRRPEQLRRLSSAGCAWSLSRNRTGSHATVLLIADDAHEVGLVAALRARCGRGLAKQVRWRPSGGGVSTAPTLASSRH